MGVLCGFSTRWLAPERGAHRVTAADIDHQAVRFCVHEFGVRPLFVPRRWEHLSFAERYDLVFVGSLLTHLPLPTTAAILKVLAQGVRPGGLLVFSTQGGKAASATSIGMVPSSFGRPPPTRHRAIPSARTLCPIVARHLRKHDSDAFVRGAHDSQRVWPLTAARSVRRTWLGSAPRCMDVSVRRACVAGASSRLAPCPTITGPVRTCGGEHTGI